MDLTFMRQGYQNEGLSKEELSPDPFLQFESWFKEANETEPIPNAMSLATVNHSGSPMMRTVLLKLFDDNGFVFFTNYKSRKAEQISENQNVAVLFNWVALERQVSIDGVAEKVETSESLKYFMGRPRGSQLGAWVSDQRSVLSSRKILELKLDEIKRKFADRKYRCRIVGVDSELDRKDLNFGRAGLTVFMIDSYIQRLMMNHGK